MLDLVRKNIAREPDGKLSLHVDFTETDTGKVIESLTVQGMTPAEIESELRPKIQAMIDKYLAQKNLNAAADARIDALKTELGLPVGGTQ